jgi:hypothetical protein
MLFGQLWFSWQLQSAWRFFVYYTIFLHNSKINTMGTRNKTMVISNEKVKVSQYGQWDGYPSGQGADILKFLQNTDLKEFKAKVDQLEVLTEQDTEVINKILKSGERDYKKDFPEYHRDTAAGILDLIMQDKIWNKKMLITKDDYWIQYFYTIDLDNNVLIVEGDREATFDLDNLPSLSEFLTALDDADE